MVSAKQNIVTNASSNLALTTKIKNYAIMGFLTNIIGATVKVALTPVAAVKDVVNIATGDEVDATKSLLESAVDNVEDAASDLGDGDLL